MASVSAAPDPPGPQSSPGSPNVRQPPGPASPPGLLDPAWQMRWRVPELALVLSDRAAALARRSGDQRTRLRAEALALFAMNRLGRGVAATPRAITAVRDADALGDAGLSAWLRVELACCAYRAGSGDIALGVLSPVLRQQRIDPGLRAHALLTLATVLPVENQHGDRSEAIDEAERLFAAGERDWDTIRLFKAGASAVRALHYRCTGELAQALAAVDRGVELLRQLSDPAADGVGAFTRLMLERAQTLLESGRHADAMAAGETVLTQPVRAASAEPLGWLGMAMATRVHLPGGDVASAIRLLADAAALAERHKLDGLVVEALNSLSLVYERGEDFPAALRTLRSAYAADRRWRSALHAAQTRLLATFPAGQASSAAPVHPAGEVTRQAAPGQVPSANQPENTPVDAATPTVMFSTPSPPAVMFGPGAGGGASPAPETPPETARRDGNPRPTSDQARLADALRSAEAARSADARQEDRARPADHARQVAAARSAAVARAAAEARQTADAAAARPVSTAASQPMNQPAPQAELPSDWRQLAQAEPPSRDEDLNSLAESLRRITARRNIGPANEDATSILPAITGGTDPAESVPAAAAQEPPATSQARPEQRQPDRPRPQEQAEDPEVDDHSGDAVEEPASQDAEPEESESGRRSRGKSLAEIRAGLHLPADSGAGRRRARRHAGQDADDAGSTDTNESTDTPDSTGTPESTDSEGEEEPPVSPMTAAEVLAKLQEHRSVADQEFATPERSEPLPQRKPARQPEPQADPDQAPAPKPTPSEALAEEVLAADTPEDGGTTGLAELLTEALMAYEAGRRGQDPETDPEPAGGHPVSAVRQSTRDGQEARTRARHREPGVQQHE